MVMAPALDAISTDTSKLIFLRDSWVASDVFSLLLVTRVAIASLEIFDIIYRLNVGIQILSYLLLILSLHLHLNCNFKSFFWRY